MKRRDAILIAASSALASCGYRVSGHADLLPKEMRTIAVVPLGNVTAKYRISDRLPAAVTREFLSRTRYRVVADPNQADGILQMAVLTYNSYPTIFDPATGRAAGIQMLMVLQAKLTERTTGKVYFDRPAFEARQRYEISTDQQAYFDESGVGLDRLAQDVARQLVSAILENF
jgi:outer membrane lipopolysaccharide assembly protein LptE/RlpB